MASSPLERPVVSQFMITCAALLCGTCLWLVVQLTATQEVTLNINVVPVNVESEVILDVRPDQIPVKFSFPATEANRMKPDNFWIEVDFSEIKDRVGAKLEDSGDRTLLREWIRDSVSGATTNITPTELLVPQVSWSAKLRHTTALIEPTVVGQPAEGFVYEPERAIIDGSREITVLLTRQKEEELRKSQETVRVPTAPINITGKQGIMTEQVDLELPEGMSLLPGQSASDRTIIIDLVERTETRTISDVPIEYRFLIQEEGLRAIVEPPTVDVVITGKYRSVRAITPDKISFGLYGVAERPGESREIAVDARITEEAYQRDIESVTTLPPTVTVTIEQIGPTPTPEAAVPTPTPWATPIMTPVPLPLTDDNRTT